MACAHPLQFSQIKSHSVQPFRSSFPKEYLLYTQIPCRYCLNCRVDRRNELADRAQFEYCKHLVGSFVTFTYDDYHLMSECPIGQNGSSDELIFSLNYDHVRKFIDRLRVKVRRANAKEQAKNPSVPFRNVLMQDDFSYLYVGEYGKKGELFDRPHFHVLFFGLDFAACKKLFYDEWKKGFIDSLPILDGGINYVLKYMDKQLFGFLAQEQYDFKGLARPKCVHSNRFGYGLFLEPSRLKDIREHDFTYPVAHNKRRPVPQYVQSIIRDSDENRYSFEFKRDIVVNQMRDVYSLKDFSSKAVAAFKKRQADFRERFIYQNMVNNGEPALNPILFDLYSNKSFYYSPDYRKIRFAPLSKIREAEKLYRQQLETVFSLAPVPF